MVSDVNLHPYMVRTALALGWDAVLLLPVGRCKLTLA